MFKRIKLYTNIQKTNTDDNPKVEVEQKLIINGDGKVVFTSSMQGKGYGHYDKGRKIEIEVDKEIIKEIFEEIERNFEEIPTYNVIPGFGMWNLSILENGNKSREYYGVTSGVLNGLTNYIQRRIPIDHLMLFL